MSTLSIFDSRGKFRPLSASDRDTLAPADRARYEAVADAATTCEASEARCIELESILVRQTAEIRSMTAALARHDKPVSFMDEWRRMRDQ